MHPKETVFITPEEGPIMGLLPRSWVSILTDLTKLRMVNPECQGPVLASDFALTQWLNKMAALFWNLQGVHGKKPCRWVKEPKGYHCHREEKGKQYTVLQSEFLHWVSDESLASPWSSHGSSCRDILGPGECSFTSSERPLHHSRGKPFTHTQM